MAAVSVPVNVGLAEKTALPVPVSSSRIPANSLEVSTSVDRRTRGSRKFWEMVDVEISEVPVP